MQAQESPAEIDESLYSRQLYVLGHEAMRRLASTSVLVSGMKGLGVEIAKNVILAGVKSVTVHDPGDAQWSDLSSQFFLSENDVGHNRAIASQKRLAELNSYVVVTAYTGALSESFLEAFQVVVLTNSSLEEQLYISDFCHARNICFIVADTKGLAGQLFCDFGQHFVVHDPTEVEPICAYIQHISQDNPGVLTCVDKEGHSHDFVSGDFVTFSGVEGMTELNACEPRAVRVLGEYMLEIGDTSSFSPYQRGGLVTQVKVPQEHSYEPLRAALANLKIKDADPEKQQRYHSLHLAFQALHVFCKEQSRLPQPRVQVDAEQLLKLAQDLNVQQEPLEEDLVRAFASMSAGELSPIAAVFGGLAAQEVLKAASGKFLPLAQWLYFDALECLPKDGAASLTEESCAPRGCRYDGQIAVFGANFQERLGQQKYFVVGSGAIGCELLKNFAMMGLAAGKGGNITVTDMDTIERSNLNRQFLFRPWDISKLKSEVAAEAVRRMNPHINIVAHDNQVGPTTELQYGEDFFQPLDGVASALDSMRALFPLCSGTYVDSQCIRYLKPLLDSGTQGTKGHVQVIVPHLTEPFGNHSDPLEKAIPVCTLRHFPSSIEHTLQWARDEFEGLFRLPAENVNRYLQDSTFLDGQQPSMEALEVLELVRSSLLEKPQSWQDCVYWARHRWESLYHNSIQQLLHSFPPDHVTSLGIPFWSGIRKCPRPLEFDCNNDTHMQYIIAAASLFAQMHKLQMSGDTAAIQETLHSTTLLPFKPQAGVKIPVTDEELQETSTAADEGRLAKLSQELAELRHELVSKNLFSAYLMEPIHFEKDDDSNCHIDFITVASNLRAENYGIPPADKCKSKRIAGRIVPAIATTTAAVAGLACLELFKLVWGHQHLSAYCNSFLQLSEPRLTRFQPLPASTCKYGQKMWSCWDRFRVQGIRDDGKEMTLQELLDHLKTIHSLAVSMLLHEQATLYHSLWSKQKQEERLIQRLTQLIRGDASNAVQQLPPVLVLQVICEDEDDDTTLPPIHLRLR
ncbi:ubiquitin-like modifier-activating enzyme 7 isoform X1 [Alligator mississippiensis]|uniref:ubiquitin-like modifier-activating enzyme 7 isoform X1 n=1 Tax=Alligator mississippiensis TaxID=8496 RepID=UPI00090720A0|nr:ubiquitin-like modifier-activating enzyme 7 isoform X1 [Alligator mississippiensis]XP_019352557.1 ubiquitin-like modifier-activating enzyme 7 isoform X1 [Alligator mississippiensis]